MSWVRNVHDMSRFDEELAVRQRLKRQHMGRYYNRQHHPILSVGSDDESDTTSESILPPPPLPQSRNSQRMLKVHMDRKEDIPKSRVKDLTYVDTQPMPNDSQSYIDEYYDYTLEEKLMWMQLANKLLTILLVLVIGGIMLVGFKLLATFIIQLASLQ